MRNPKPSPVELEAERNLCDQCERVREREFLGICQFRDCGELEFEASGICFHHCIVAAAAIQRPSPKIVHEYEYVQPDTTDPMRTSVVYYVAINAYVKIGFSRSLAQRFNEFHVPKSALLAIEPGGLRVERKRHQQFAHLRVERELFIQETELAEHIAAARQMFGDPLVFMEA